MLGVSGRVYFGHISYYILHMYAPSTSLMPRTAWKGLKLQKCLSKCWKSREPQGIGPWPSRASPTVTARLG